MQQQQQRRRRPLLVHCWLERVGWVGAATRRCRQVVHSAAPGLAVSRTAATAATAAALPRPCSRLPPPSLLPPHFRLQTINCLELWAKLLAAKADEPELRPLIYPVSQVGGWVLCVDRQGQCRRPELLYGVRARWRGRRMQAGCTSPRPRQRAPRPSHAPPLNSPPPVPPSTAAAGRGPPGPRPRLLPAAPALRSCAQPPGGGHRHLHPRGPPPAGGPAVEGPAAGPQARRRAAARRAAGAARQQCGHARGSLPGGSDQPGGAGAGAGVGRVAGGVGWQTGWHAGWFAWLAWVDPASRYPSSPCPSASVPSPSVSSASGGGLTIPSSPVKLGVAPP